MEEEQVPGDQNLPGREDENQEKDMEESLAILKKPKVKEEVKERDIRPPEYKITEDSDGIPKIEFLNRVEGGMPVKYEVLT